MNLGPRGIFGSLLLALLACPGCEQETEWEDTGDHQSATYAERARSSSLRAEELLGVMNRAPPARWLAAIEQGNERPSASQVRVFGYALERLDGKFYEDDRMIGNRTVQLHRMLKEEGIDTSLLNILRGFASISKDARLKNYGELCAHYFNLRAGGRNHQGTVLALRTAD